MTPLGGVHVFTRVLVVGNSFEVLSNSQEAGINGDVFIRYGRVMCILLLLYQREGVGASGVLAICKRMKVYRF